MKTQYYLFPTLYKEDTGANEDSDRFIGLEQPSEAEKTLIKWTMVEKVCWGIYRTVGNPFFDYKPCYRKIK
jgi:hypothetical protein